MVTVLEHKVSSRGYSIGTQSLITWLQYWNTKSHHVVTVLEHKVSSHGYSIGNTKSHHVVTVLEHKVSSRGYSIGTQSLITWLQYWNTKSHHVVTVSGTQSLMRCLSMYVHCSTRGSIVPILTIMSDCSLWAMGSQARNCKTTTRIHNTQQPPSNDLATPGNHLATT